MNEFVSGVVSEILSSGSGVPQGSAGTIERPNYQRKTAQQRLISYELATAVPPEKKAIRLNIGPARMKIDMTPGIRVAGLAAMVAQAFPQTAKQDTDYQVQALPAEGDFIIIERPDRRLINLLRLPCKTGDAIGILKAQSCTLSQIFAVDEAANTCPALGIAVDWNENITEPFTFRCAGKIQDVKKAVGIIQAGLSSGTRVCRSLAPSYLLLQKLRLSGRQIIGLDDIDYIRSFRMIQQFYEQNPDSSLEFIPKEHFLLAQGQPEEAERALNSFISRSGRKGSDRC